MFKNVPQRQNRGAKLSDYWPAQLAGQASGFEFHTGSISDGFGAPPPSGIDELDLVANFVTHSDVSELRCSMFAAGAFASAAKGLVFDEETGGVRSAENLLAQARSIDS